MPYENERAGYRALQRLLIQQDEDSAWRTWQHDHSIREHHVESVVVEKRAWQPRTIIAFDGSVVPVPFNQNPTICVGSLSIAAVILDWQRLMTLDRHRPVDPIELRSCQQVATFSGIMPSGLLTDANANPAPAVFRQQMYELLQTSRAPIAQETLLATYEALQQLRSKQTQTYQRCPWWQTGCLHKVPSYHATTSVSACLCKDHKHLYSTDILRLHERYTRQGINTTVWNETLRVLEQLWFVHHLRALATQHAWEELRETVFMLDGPLAIFGVAGWLSRAIRLEIRRISDLMSHAQPDSSLLILGIEKTGAFVEYFAALDSDGMLPNQTLLLVDDSTIKQYIVRRQSQRPYGRNTYYGTKCLYKTQAGKRIVFTMFQAEKPSVPKAMNGIPRLYDALAVIEQTFSARYNDALLPLVIAHAETALPRAMTATVLGSSSMWRSLHRDVPLYEV